jgi:hypothetical protein
VSAERLFDLARHLTERDREVALYLYRHRVLTPDQLQLLFFSSRRRAQDRLLFLYRNRVLDRFYPPAPFGSGKPEAHWLLDEAGAILVAATLDLERKQLRWQRRDDWGSHPRTAAAGGRPVRRSVGASRPGNRASAGLHRPAGSRRHDVGRSERDARAPLAQRRSRLLAAAVAARRRQAWPD